MSKPPKPATPPADPNQLPPGLVLTADELARALKCSRTSIDAMAREGSLPPAAKVGRLLRWPRSVIAAWLAAGMPPVKRST